MRLQIAAVTAAILLVALPALADDVYLTNGRAFEGVQARVTATHVVLRMPFGGEITLQRSQVDRIEESESTFQEYLRRAEDLRSTPGAGPGDWLDLARWALANDLRHSAREAARIAGVLDPHLPELAPLLRGFGFALDADLGRWISHDEYMRRQGFVSHDGEWVTRAEQAERIRARNVELAAARERERARRDARREAVPYTQPPVVAVAPVEAPVGVVYAVPQVVYAVPGTLGAVHGGFFQGATVFGGGFHRHRGRGGGHRGGPPPAGRQVTSSVQHAGPVLDALERVPGSLIPGRLSSSSPR